MSVTYGSDSEKCIKPAKFVVSLLTPLLPQVIKKKLLPIISYIIQETGNENTQTYRVEVVILVKHQILVINLRGHLLQLKGRINDRILGVRV